MNLATDEHGFTQIHARRSGCSFRNPCFIRVNLWLVFPCEGGA
jgi:hypothetical protein